MKLYRLGHVPWLQSQLLYHALPRLGMEGVMLLSPASPYVCVGYHQDAGQEVDLEYCRQYDIPVFRREVGGGAVYLDGRQLFYQIVLDDQHPLAAGDKATVYARLLAPVVETYGDLGIPARYKPINDIVTEAGRKISGNGAAYIEHSFVLVGNLIFDFDYERMARVLRVPDEKYRDKVHKSLYENLTTIRRELGRVPPEEEVISLLVKRFEKVLGPLEPATLPREVLDKAAELEPQFTSDAWLLARARRAALGRDVRIAAGVHVLQRMRKVQGGLVRATLELKDNVIASLSITGDFFFYPEHKLAELEKRLEGVRLDEVGTHIEDFYRQEGIESPGLTPAELAAILQDVQPS